MDFVYHATVDTIFKTEHVSTPPQILPYQQMQDDKKRKMEFVLDAQIIGSLTQKDHVFQYLTNAKPSILKVTA